MTLKSWTTGRWHLARPKPSFASGKSGSFTQVSKYDTTSDWDLARLRYLALDAPASWRAANERIYRCLIRFNPTTWL